MTGNQTTDDLDDTENAPPAYNLTPNLHPVAIRASPLLLRHP